ncbi:MAG: ROK family protein [Gemmatimonadales bacterium]|nr:ROK family protein [Gemmatimonadales bacterium]
MLIGVDVGGTRMSGGLVRADGNVLSVVQAPTHRDGPGTALDTLLDLIADVIARAAELRVPIEGVGIGVPGVVDAEAGVMKKGVHLLPELTGVPLAERVEGKTGIRTFVDNDVNALALGEWTWGVGRGARSLAMLAVGTGVGGAVILDGRVVRGHSGYGGEFGHVPIKFDGKLCVCGARGCLCTYVCGHDIALDARRRVHDEPGSTLLARSGGDPSTITARLVFEAATAGDALARSIVDEACQALAAGLAVIVNGLDPEVIVVTGGVAGSLLPLQGEILRRLREHAFAEAMAGTRIHFVPGDKCQTVRGGAALVLYERARRAG